MGIIVDPSISASGGMEGLVGGIFGELNCEGGAERGAMVFASAPADAAALP